MHFSDDIHNYYEKLVTDHLQELNVEEQLSNDEMADLCCLILNKLPARYIRHEVDMAFYLPSTDRLEMLEKVKKATADSMKFLSELNR